MSELKPTAVETTQKTAAAPGTVDIQSLCVREQTCKSNGDNGRKGGHH